MNLPEPPPGKTGWPWTEISDPLPPTMPDGSPWPKISVVTPSFNQGRFIEQTIRSVLLQDYPNLEFIIIDGGSTDNTIEIIKKYEVWLAYWVSEPDRGQSHAINKGIKQATGVILFWLNSDDLVFKNVFGLVGDIFAGDEKLALLIGQSKLIDVDGNFIGELHSSYTSWEEAITNPQNSVRQVSTFFRRTLFEHHGNIDESLNLAMDSDILLRFTKYVNPHVIDQYLSAFRIHGASKSRNEIILAYEESDRVRKKYIETEKNSKIHKMRSAQHWLNLSKKENLPINDRLVCLRHSLEHKPRVIFKPEFLRSLIDIMGDKLASGKK